MNEYREYLLRYCSKEGYSGSWIEREIKFWDRDDLEHAYEMLGKDKHYFRNIRKFQIDIKEEEI